MILDKGFYADGKGAQSWTCSFVYKAESIQITWSELDLQRVDWKFQDLSSVESSGTSVLITHRNGSSLLVSGPLAQKILMDHQNHSQQNRQRQGLLSKQNLYVILGISTIVLLGATLLYLFALPWLAEKAIVMIPVETEIGLGEKITETMTGNLESQDSANLYLDEFVRQLKLDKTYPINVRLIVSEEINAFALPGGNIFIYSGLLEKIESPEELVALIGHEVTHVTKRHSLKSMIRSMASGLLFSFLLGDASGLVAQADQFKQLDYSRELETEADDQGLRMMVENKVNPEGMLSLLQILKLENEQMPQLMKYLSTHPETEERIQHIKAQSLSTLEFDKNLDLILTFQKLKAQLKE